MTRRGRRANSDRIVVEDTAVRQLETINQGGMKHGNRYCLMAHLMRRAGFGAPYQELEARAAKG